MTGVDFGLKSIRVTHLEKDGELGEAYVVRGGKIRITPVIESGETVRGAHSSYRGPDIFRNWEFELSTKADMEDFMLERDHVAFEFWTELIEPVEGWRRLLAWLRRLLGHRTWIHWVFPRTTWDSLRDGRVFFGLSERDDSGRTFDAPDDTPLSEGGYFLTEEAPPRA